MSAFHKATKTRAKLRLALIGPAGSGKTYSALSIAQGLGDKIALVDTEYGSASKYADRFTFDTLELTSCAPERYIDAITDASASGYDVLIIDSLSHAWAGKDGLLEFVDKRAKASDTGNSFGAWRDATPKHNALVDALLAAPLHLIVTMRAKMEYVLEKNDKGKSVPRKVGLQPIQRDGLEYEFDIVGDMKLEGKALVVSKTRYSGLAEEVIEKPGKKLGQRLKAWLSDGVEQAPVTATAVDAPVTAQRYISKPQRDRFWAIAKESGWPSKEAVKAWLLTQAITSSARILVGSYDDVIAALKDGPPSDIPALLERAAQLQADMAEVGAQ